MNPFPTKDPGETVTLGFDYTRTLEAGESITSAVWECEDSDGSAVTDVINGTPIITNGKIVKQSITGGVLGQTYLHRAFATTNATPARVLVLGNTQRIVKGGFNG